MLQIEDIKKTFNPGTITEKRRSRGLRSTSIPGILSR